jgi:hypothetical protein
VGTLRERSIQLFTKRFIAAEFGCKLAGDGYDWNISGLIKRTALRTALSAALRIAREDGGGAGEGEVTRSSAAPFIPPPPQRPAVLCHFSLLARVK